MSPNRTQVSRVLAGNTAKVIPRLKPSGFGPWLFPKLPGEKSKFLRLLFQTAHAGQKNGSRCCDHSSTTGSNQILPKEWILHPGQKTTAKWFKTTDVLLCCRSDDDKSRIQHAGKTSPLLTLITWVETLLQIRPHSSAPGTGYLNVPFKGWHNTSHNKRND